ncbi:uncharacterized protein LOC123505497 isoform X2 [Portunus trituberculatus]|uniref:uncharacterized protein LOC123505497 isoform X2 n=1 Tax=Portunus trituberculatus TaxID=210409 RepID=UPI001E1CE328|nr:uncharacterized protein LOC123505497 isoform X2 [Portunus trituberculatus]
MASSSTDTDVGPPTDEEQPQAGGRAPGEAPEQEEQMEEGKGGPPGAGLHAKRPHATVKERTVEVRETWSENIHGLDNLTLAINSLDDHVQAGLQEVRNCVGILRHEKNELLKQVRSLSEVVRETSIQRDRYKEATVQLQQEVASLREQLEVQKEEKDILSRRMQELENQDEQHLENIARTLRSKRLAHSTLVKWRKKVHERSGSKALQVLEEENSRLRSELLLCQEAAKQAFLRSANALNSEAITMFQDAATRRLGGDEEDDGERPPSPESSSASSSSSSAHPHNTQDKEGFAEGGGNKENVANKGDRDRGEKVHERWHREEDAACSSDHFHHASGVPKQSDRNVIYSSTFRGNSKDYRVNHTCSAPSRIHWRREEEDEYEEAIDSGSFSHYVRKPSRSRTGHEEPHFRAPSPPPWGEASGGGGGAVPKPRLSRSDFIPDTLQQEARARLQQLQRQQYLRPEPPASSFEPQRKTKRVMTSGSPKKACSCRLLSLSAPYKCPYCTPIHNSDYGHYKTSKKSVNKVGKNKGGSMNVVSSTTMKTDNKGVDKKVIYNPNACTVLIEKHINK